MKSEIISKIPLIAFGLFFIKCMALGVGYPDVLTLAILCGFSAFYEFKKESAQTKKFEEELARQKNDILTLNNQIASIKMGMGFKQVKF
jgi:hypothetical protein